MSTPALACDRSNEKWPCRLTRDWSIQLERLKGRVESPYCFRTEAIAQPDTGRGEACTEWLRLEVDGTVTIRSGYGTDGCSAVPNFPNALPGCVLHDALRQATTLDPDCPWTRGEADVIFREVMRDYGFNWLGRWIYYLGVAGPTGWVYSKLSRWLKPPSDRIC